MPACWLTLAVAAAALSVLTVRTARAPQAPVPDRATYFAGWSALHGGYDPQSAFWPRTWLRLSYAAARPLAVRGLAPDVLTGWGVLVAALVPLLCAAGGRWPLLAVIVIVVSGLADNIDGAVAVLNGRSTDLGYVLDSVVDRISDSLYAAALWLLGAPGLLCVLGGGLTGLQEYARARAGAAGMHEVGVVTVWERPTRVVVTAFTLGFAGLVPGRADDVATVGAAAWLGLAVVGLGQLGVVLTRRLRTRR